MLRCVRDFQKLGEIAVSYMRGLKPATVVLVSETPERPQKNERKGLPAGPKKERDTKKHKDPKRHSEGTSGAITPKTPRN